MFGDAVAGAFEELYRELRVFCEALDGVGKRDGALFGNEQAADVVDDYVGNAADVARDDGQSAFHGFDEYDAQAFGVALVVDDGGQYKDVRFAVFAGEFRCGELAGEQHVRVLGGLLLELAGEVAFADDADFELVLGQVLGGFDEIADALAFDMAAHEQDLELPVDRMGFGGVTGVSPVPIPI